MCLHFTPEQFAEVCEAARLCGAPDPETFMMDAIAQAVDEVFADADTSIQPLRPKTLRLFPG